MKYAIGPRKELAMRTIFNILGPMTNPAGVKRMLVGVFDGELCRPMAEVLGRLGAEHVMVVHSDDGLDEISTAANTRVAEFRDGALNEFVIDPADYGLRVEDLSGLEVEDAEASLALICSALNGVNDARSAKAAGIIALNAGAAIHVAGLCESIAEGVEKARAVIADGSAWRRLRKLSNLTNGFVE
jgi:anthranilate phosphoribosyltransferase